MICRVWRVARSSAHAARAETEGAPTPAVARRRGPPSRWGDDEVEAALQAIVRASPFHSEGHRKLRARLRAQGITIGTRPTEPQIEYIVDLLVAKLAASRPDATG